MKAAQARLGERSARRRRKRDRISASNEPNLRRSWTSAQNNSHSLQEKLDSLAQQSAQDAARAKASEAKVNDLTHLLQDREAALEQQDELLAHDRDIRDLMGARDLYIAEVYDVAGTGETQKPYGRVFYTRGKSLIFYAYDLDQQTEVEEGEHVSSLGPAGAGPATSHQPGHFL